MRGFIITTISRLRFIFRDVWALMLCFSLFSPGIALAASFCHDIFADPNASVELSASPEFLARLDGNAKSWVDPRRTKFKSLSADVVLHMLRESLSVVVVGGSSIHGIFPGSDRNISAKLYFAAPGPQSFAELTEHIVDSAMPSLQYILAHGSGKNPILLVPTPGKISPDQSSIELPANFGVIGKKEYQLSKMVSESIARRAQILGIKGLQAVKVIVKNDSFTLSATIGSDMRQPAGRRVRVIFAGTGLGESSIAITKPGFFADVASESGHLKLDDYAGLQNLIPKAIINAAQVVRLSQNVDHLEFENLVAGGRPTKHLGALLSVLISARLPEASVPSWILSANGGKAFVDQSIINKFHLNSDSPADLDLIEKVKAHGSVQLEDVSAAAKSGGKMAWALMEEATYLQGVFVGVLATEFGNTPSGEILSADMAFSGINDRQLHRSIYIRPDGALEGWSTFMTEALRGFTAGINFQLRNPSYLAKLKAAGIRPKDISDQSFTLIYGLQSHIEADPDLQGLATLQRANFEP